jgi:hypothetical protein
VDGIAGLTAVDGATVITDRHHLLGFGAKIVRRHGSMQVDRVMTTEPIEVRSHRFWNRRSLVELGIYPPLSLRTTSGTQLH